MTPTPCSLVLLPDVAGVRSARAFVHEQCRHLGMDSERCDSAALMVSELVTNAFLHGRSEARIVVVASGALLRVEVADDDSRHPALVSQDDAALDGRGLVIVEALSTSWGVRDEMLGKTVWFEV